MADVGRPKMYESPEEMQKVLDKYFEDCERRDWPILLEGIARALEMDDKTLYTYGHADSHSEFHPTIKKAKLRCREDLWARGLMQQYSSAVTIFNLKNNYGYADKVEQEITGNPDKPLNCNIVINQVTAIKNEFSNKEEDVI